MLLVGSWCAMRQTLILINLSQGKSTVCHLNLIVCQSWHLCWSLLRSWHLFVIERYSYCFWSCFFALYRLWHVRNPINAPTCSESPRECPDVFLLALTRTLSRFLIRELAGETQFSFTALDNFSRFRRLQRVEFSANFVVSVTKLPNDIQNNSCTHKSVVTVSAKK